MSQWTGAAHGLRTYTKASRHRCHAARATRNRTSRPSAESRGHVSTLALDPKLPSYTATGALGGATQRGAGAGSRRETCGWGRPSPGVPCPPVTAAAPAPHTLCCPPVWPWERAFPSALTSHHHAQPSSKPAEPPSATRHPRVQRPSQQEPGPPATCLPPPLCFLRGTGPQAYREHGRGAWPHLAGSRSPCSGAARWFLRSCVQGRPR